VIHIGYATTLHAVVGCERFFATVFSLRVDDMTAFRTPRKINSKIDALAPETILESPRDMFEVPHPASTRRLSALSLLSPLERP